jgi:hypothetical protein
MAREGQGWLEMQKNGLLVALFAAWLWIGTAQAQWLSYTAPAAVQDRWYVVDPVAGDSTIFIECSGDRPIPPGPLTAYLWGYRTSGGGWTMAESHAVSPGAPDSFAIPYPGHFYVITANAAGPSCASEVMELPPPIITTVPYVPPPDRVVAVRLYDVQGRLVRGKPRASGVYFRRTVWLSGRRDVARVVVVR